MIEGIVKSTNGGSGDIMLDIAQGRISGTTCITKFGENKNSPAGVETPIWDVGTAYTYDAFGTALITHLSQDVDQATMRGASIEVQGLDIAGVLTNQTIPLDATLTTTKVPLTTPLWRVFRLKVNANVLNLQNILATNAAGTTTYARITGVYNQTQMALYTVPLGVTAYMTQYHGDVLEDPVATKDPDATEFLIYAADRSAGYEFQLKYERGIPKGSSGFTHPFKPYKKFTELTDIKMVSECSGKAGHIHAGFDLILVNN